MDASSGYGLGSTLHRVSRRFFAELAISLFASLAVTLILASSSPKWPTHSPTPARTKLTARADPDPQLAHFVESVALSHVGPERDEASAPPLKKANVRLAAFTPEDRPKPRVEVRREVHHLVLPPPRPIELSAAIPAAAPAQKPTPAVFRIGSRLLGGVSEARSSLVARVDSLGASITGLVPRIQ